MSGETQVLAPDPLEQQRQRFHLFCRAVVLPAMADGHIAPAEDGVLLAAFSLLGLGKLWQVDRDWMKVTLDQLGSGAAVAAEAKEFEALLSAVKEPVERITHNQAVQLTLWLNAQTANLGVIASPLSLGECVFEDTDAAVRYEAWRRWHLESFLVHMAEEAAARAHALDEAEASGAASGEGGVAKIIEGSAVFDPDAEKELLHETARALQPESREEGILGDAAELLATSRPLGLARVRQDVSDRVMIVPATETGETWFIGDIHGDVLALTAALRHIRKKRRSDADIVFLGDLVDRGRDGMQVFLAVLEILLQAPERVCILAGNHDEAVRQDGRHFLSDVSPAEFVDWLNGEPGNKVRRQVGELFIKLFDQAPRALFFSDGLMVAHGGFPHQDLLPGLRSLSDLNQPDCLRDFVWTRASESARKRPNRRDRGCQFGWQNLAEFCRAVEPLFAFPIRCFLRGHDHYPARLNLHPTYARVRMVTINTMGHRLRDEFEPEAYATAPYVACWRDGTLEVTRLQVADHLVKTICPETLA